MLLMCPLQHLHFGVYEFLMQSTTYSLPGYFKVFRILFTESSEQRVCALALKCCSRKCVSKIERIRRSTHGKPELISSSWVENLAPDHSWISFVPILNERSSLKSLVRAA